MRKSLPGNWAAAPLVVAVLFACVSVPTTAEEAGGRTHIVEIRKLQFSPAELEVAPGDTITWMNHDLVPHTATSNDDGWDSGLIKAGGEWETIVTEDMRGRYYCRFHPSMVAIIDIKSE